MTEPQTPGPPASDRQPGTAPRWHQRLRGAVAVSLASVIIGGAGGAALGTAGGAQDGGSDRPSRGGFAPPNAQPTP